MFDERLVLKVVQGHRPRTRVIGDHLGSELKGGVVQKLSRAKREAKEEKTVHQLPRAKREATKKSQVHQLPRAKREAKKKSPVHQFPRAKREA